MKTPKPPVLADKLLGLIYAPHQLESILGDLHEEFDFQVGKVGGPRARLLYWQEALGFVKPRYIKRQKSSYQATYLFSLDMLRNYFTIAWRTLVHNKVYSFINVVGLSIGLAAAMLILLYTKDEVSFDQFHANNPNIYRITNKYISPNGQLNGVTGISGYMPGPKFAAGVPEIEAFVRYHWHRSDIKKGNEVESEEAFRVDPSFLSVFSFPLLSGDPKTALVQPKSVVISEEMAVKQFGKTDVLGKTILMKDSYDETSRFEPYAVTGVARTLPQNSSIKFNILIPMLTNHGEMERSSNWFNTFLNTFVLVRPGADMKQVEYPAIVLSGYNPVKTVYNRLQLSGKNHLQTSLVVLQFTIASFLIIGTLTINSQFNYLINKDLGFNDEHLVSVEKSNLTRAEAHILRQELEKDPNILAVAPKNGGRWNTSAKVNNQIS